MKSSDKDEAAEVGGGWRAPLDVKDSRHVRGAQGGEECVGRVRRNSSASSSPPCCDYSPPCNNAAHNISVLEGKAA